MYKLAIIGALFVVSTLAAPASQDAEVAPPSIIEEALDVYGSCSGESNVAVCLKLKALRYVDRVVRSADIEVFDGFKIVQTEEAKNSRADNARSLNDIENTLPAETEAKEAAIDQALVDRAAKFLSTHTVELSLPEDVARSFDEARGKKKKIVKSLLPILLLLKLKAAALIPIALGALALIAVKALIIGKIALVISLIIALQKLLAYKSQSYEVVAHPVHDYGHEVHHDHHGWARSASGSDLAYNAYKPAE
ncbi:Osiris 9 [Camponotus japonicus]